MRRVYVAGAGFAGLTVAYELLKQGFEVEIYERGEDPGGLISTHRTAYGLVETAANALMCNEEIETLFAELELPFAERHSARKRRYIYWEGPRRWPLTLGTTAKALMQALRLSFGQEDLLPVAGESISEWARRFAGEEFEQRLLAPALQGIYAGDPENMSAVLVLKNLLGTGDKVAKGAMKGSVAPAGGMGALIKALVKAIEYAGGVIKYDSTYAFPMQETEPTVVATPAWSAAEVLRKARPEMAQALDRCQSLPLVSATFFFEPQDGGLNGFGCLFPRQQGFTSLGVLFNDCIFEGRSRVRSETWILGGVHYPDIIAHSDEDLMSMIQADRKKLLDKSSAPLDYKFTRWHRAIPHYTLDWERTLMTLNPEPPLYLHGNYLGDLGLARIYSRSIKLAAQIKEAYG